MTLALDFQGQILKKLYLRNGRADWHGIKGMSVDMMLDALCELLPLPWIFNVNKRIAVSRKRDGRLIWNERDVSR